MKVVLITLGILVIEAFEQLTFSSQHYSEISRKKRTFTNSTRTRIRVTIKNTANGENPRGRMVYLTGISKGRFFYSYFTRIKNHGYRK